MTATPKNKLPLSESQFQMWRAVIAIAQADGKIQPEERAQIDRALGALDRVHGLTEAQKKTVNDDFAAPKKVASILPLITEPQFRGELIHFAQAIAWADNELSVDEEGILTALKAGQMTVVDQNQLRADVKKHLADTKAAHEKDMQSIRANTEKSPFIRALNRLLSKAGIDILG